MNEPKHEFREHSLIWSLPKKYPQWPLWKRRFPVFGEAAALCFSTFRLYLLAFLNSQFLKVMFHSSALWRPGCAPVLEGVSRPSPPPSPHWQAPGCSSCLQVCFLLLLLNSLVCCVLDSTDK